MKKIQLLLSISFFMFGCQRVEPMIVYKEAITIEYGHKIKETDIFAHNQQHPKLKTIENFDTFKIGKQQITLVFSDGRKKMLDVFVKDTKKPILAFNKDRVIITSKSMKAIKDNILTVHDDIDGALPYSKQPLKQYGYYIDDHKVTLNKNGIYQVCVHAYDKNGNHQEVSFEVEVKREVKKKKQTETKVNIDDNKLPPPNKKPDEKPPVPVVEEAQQQQQEVHHRHEFDASGYEDVIWSNKIFDDASDALIWAEQYALTQDKWSIGGYSVAYCRCGLCQPFFFGVQEWKS